MLDRSVAFADTEVIAGKLLLVSRIPRRLCRILRVGRPIRWFLSDLPLVDHRDYVVPYGWVVPAGWFLLELPLGGHRDYVVSYGWVAPAGGSYGILFVVYRWPTSTLLGSLRILHRCFVIPEEAEAYPRCTALRFPAESTEG